MATNGPPRNRRTQRRQAQQAQSSRRYYITGAVVVVLLLFVGGAALMGVGGSSTSGALSVGSPIDGITCQSEMVQYHVHADLALYNYGKPVVLPGWIGIPYQNGQPYCFYSLHTHDFDHAFGVIHIESPAPRNFTLGQFLDIWSYTARWDIQNGMGTFVDSSFVDALRKAKPSDIHAYVNGKAVPAYASVTLTAHKLITLEIGAPLHAPLTTFAFPQGE